MYRAATNLIGINMADGKMLEHKIEHELTGLQG